MTELLPSPTSPAEPALYRLGRNKGATSNLWAEFIPDSSGLRRTWQLSVATRNRGGAKVVAPLLETSVLRPFATVTVKGEAYPLTIDWHTAGRGGRLEFGGERALGTGGCRLSWEMRWCPVAEEEGLLRAEMRLRTTPRRSGSLKIDLASPLHRPEVWAFPTGGNGADGAWSAWSAYSAHAIGLTALDGEGAGRP